MPKFLQRGGGSLEPSHKSCTRVSGGKPGGGGGPSLAGPGHAPWPGHLPLGGLGLLAPLRVYNTPKFLERGLALRGQHTKVVKGSARVLTKADCVARRP